jgi:hypothetical protein
MTKTLEELGFNLTPQEVSNKWTDQKIVLAGPPKCGKTSFLASHGEKTWFLRCESGFTHVKTSGVDIHDYSDFDKEITKLLAANKAGLFPWDTLAIDPGSRLMDFMGDHVVELGRQKFSNSEINEIGDIGKGTGWYWYKNLVKTTLARLDPLPCAKIIVLHVHTEEKSDNPKDKTRTYKREIISLSEKLGGPIREWADHILQVKSGYVGENMMARSLVSRGSKILEAGTRSKKLPESLSWGSDDAKNWAEFRKHFD